MGNWSGWVVGALNVVIGSVVGTPDDETSVRVGSGVRVSASVKASCSCGALVRLQAPVRRISNMNRIVLRLLSPTGCAIGKFAFHMDFHNHKLIISVLKCVNLTRTRRFTLNGRVLVVVRKRCYTRFINFVLYFSRHFRVCLMPFLKPFRSFGEWGLYEGTHC